MYKLSCAWLRLTRRKTYPWLVLIITTWRIACCHQSERNQEKVCWMAALVKIDFVRVMTLMNELLW